MLIHLYLFDSVGSKGEQSIFPYVTSNCVFWAIGFLLHVKYSDPQFFLNSSEPVTMCIGKSHFSVSMSLLLLLPSPHPSLTKGCQLTGTLILWFPSNLLYHPCCILSTVQFSRSVVSDSLQPHGLQYAKLPCPSLSPGACSNSCPSVGTIKTGLCLPRGENREKG